MYRFSGGAALGQFNRQCGLGAIVHLSGRQALAAPDRPVGHRGPLYIEVRRVPVRDFDEQDLRDKLPDCVRALAELLKAGRLRSR
jgi:hypothetical protein